MTKSELKPTNPGEFPVDKSNAFRLIPNPLRRAQGGEIHPLQRKAGYICNLFAEVPFHMKLCSENKKLK